MIDPQSSFVVRLGDSLPDLLNRLRKSSGSSVTVELSDASSLLLTASEFRALQAAAARDRIAVTVATDDPLRQQLANMFSLPVVSLASVHEAPAPPIVDATEVNGEQAGSDEVAPGNQTDLEPESNGVAPADQNFEVSGLRAARARRRTTTTPADEEVALDLAPPTDTETPSASVPTNPRKQLLIAAGIITAILVLYAGAYLFLTRATVALTLKREPIKSDLLIEVAAPGAAPASDVQISIVATPVTSQVSSTKSMNVTGVKNIGDAVARGSISLSNPTGADELLSQGTQFVDKISGTVFVLDKQVEIKAGTGGAPGFSVGTVTSAQPGTVGNRDIGLLSGKLDNGVYFSNREAAIQGGTDKQVAVVSQADLDALQQRVTDDMTAQAAKIKAGGGAVVLASSIKLTGSTFTPDHSVDETAENLTIKGSAQAEALAYYPSELKSRIGQSLSSTVQEGYVVDNDSLQLSEPVLSGDASTPGRLTIHVEGFARALLTSDQRKKIADDVAGKSKKEIDSYLASVPAVTGFELNYSPGWLPHRMPGSADRIDIETR